VLPFFNNPQGAPAKTRHCKYLAAVAVCSAVQGIIP